MDYRKDCYTEPELQKIIYDYESGISVKDISNKYHRTEHAIRVLLSRKQIKRTNSTNYNQFTTTELQEIFRKYEMGTPIEVLSKQYNHTPNSIRSTCNRNNVYRKKRDMTGYSYIYAIVQADETEIPLTPYVESLVELSKICNIPKGTLYSAISRNTKLKYKNGKTYIWGKISKVLK